jgi:sugar/nucleoside kinase (ribokinase family)
MKQTQPASAYDVLLEEGGYFCDLIFVGLPEMPRLGVDLFATDFDMHPGGVFNAALALHRLGLRAGWPCDFGNDLFSRFMLEAAGREGIDTSLFRLHDHPVRSLSASISVPHDRAFVSYRDPVKVTSLAPLVHRYRPRSILLFDLKNAAELARLRAAADDCGAIIVMDCQSHNLPEIKPHLWESLRYVDIFLPNEAEACQLTDEASLEGALCRLSEAVPLVAIKLGREGAIARAGETVVCEPGLPGLKVVDTTGAGDCFDAGFLYGYLKGKPLDVCLRCGNICGGLSTTAMGSAATPTVEELNKYLA